MRSVPCLRGMQKRNVDLSNSEIIRTNHAINLSQMFVLGPKYQVINERKQKFSPSPANTCNDYHNSLLSHSLSYQKAN